MWHGIWKNIISFALGVLLCALFFTKSDVGGHALKEENDKLTKEVERIEEERNELIIKLKDESELINTLYEDREHLDSLLMDREIRIEVMTKKMDENQRKVKTIREMMEKGGEHKKSAAELLQSIKEKL